MAELLFAPLIERIQSFGGQIMGSQLVQSIEMDAYGDVRSVTARYAPLAQVSAHVACEPLIASTAGAGK